MTEEQFDYVLGVIADDIRKKDTNCQPVSYNSKFNFYAYRVSPGPRYTKTKELFG